MFCGVDDGVELRAHLMYVRLGQQQKTKADNIRRAKEITRECNIRETNE